jgi:predicted tellurium resistance membrane protein TerC
VAIVLGFIGGKMIDEYCGYYIPTNLALGVVMTTLGSGIGLSVLEQQVEQQQQLQNSTPTLDEVLTLAPKTSKPEEETPTA